MIIGIHFIDHHGNRLWNGRRIYVHCRCHYRDPIHGHHCCNRRLCHRTCPSNDPHLYHPSNDLYPYLPSHLHHAPSDPHPCHALRPSNDLYLPCAHDENYGFEQRLWCFLWL